MILVTAGHEKGIGLEVFLKSFLSLNSDDQKLFKLYTNLDAVSETLNSLNIKIKNVSKTSIDFGSARLHIHSLDSSSIPLSSQAIHQALKDLQEGDILFTLPTSKDQTTDEQGNTLSGHTELFRKIFKNQNISMIFNNDNHNVLLVTDHIPLNSVATVITEELIINKIRLTLAEMEKYQISTIRDVYISGINPHCGESGSLGTEDSKVNDAIMELKKIFPSRNFFGPISADTMHLNTPYEQKLFVYMSHDQGLGVFKSINGLVGMNISLGLPNLRVSVDHGTSFNLFGKGIADYQGCLKAMKFCIKKALPKERP